VRRPVFKDRRKIVGRKRSPVGVVHDMTGKKKCLHCNGVLSLSKFGINKMGAPKCLCLRCEAKRRVVPSRISKENSRLKNRELLETLSLTNTCAKCGDLKGPFSFFRRTPREHGKAFMVSEAVQRGPLALQRALAVSDALCPRCTLIKRREHAKSTHPRSLVARPMPYNTAPRTPARLAALFPMLKNERRVEVKGFPHNTLPTTPIALRRYGDRIAAGHHTLVTSLPAPLIKSIHP
jgi:hypothetical protein